MKYLFRVVLAVAGLALLVWAFNYIQSEENRIDLRADWGIAKDRPLR